MGLGEAWWAFDRTVEARAGELLELLDQHGLHLRQPAEQRIYVFDEVGSRRETSVNFVVSEWMAQRALTLQLWIDEDTDVLVTAEPGGTCATFDLDGLSRQQALQVVGALVLCTCAVDSSRGLVVDRCLPDSGAAWLSALLGRTTAPSDDPDLLLTSEPNGSRRITVGRNSWLRGPA